MPPRSFEDRPAVRASVPLLVGLVGPSGSGKTKSALRLATGMQRVTGGDIGGIDSEADRMLHYADDHKFRHLSFGAPFDPLSYLAAIEHFVRKGVRTIVIDSASHMHEGPGGMLEAHAEEFKRLGSDFKKSFMAWQKPKAELRRFLNAVLQLRCNLIFCFRAKEKLKIAQGQEPKPLGFMPIADDQVFYEMTLSALLYPNSGGVPSWQPEEMGEKAIIKLPGQFKTLFERPRPLDEATGEALAKWAAGGAAPAGSGGTGSGPSPAASRSSAPGAASAATPSGPPADEAALAMLEAQLVANGMREKKARWDWACGVAGRRVTAEAPLTEDECARCLARAEQEAAA